MVSKIVITGGTYAGKTAVINALGSQGYITVPEASLQIISELKQTYGTEQPRWMMSHYQQFQIMNARRQLELEQNVHGDLIYYDRGLFDYFAFCILRGYSVPNEIIAMENKVYYDIAFVLATLSDFDMRLDSGRTVDKETSLRFNGIVRNIYDTKVKCVIDIPKLPLEERLSLINSTIHSSA